MSKIQRYDADDIETLYLKPGDTLVGFSDYERLEQQLAIAVEAMTIAFAGFSLNQVPAAMKTLCDALNTINAMKETK